MQLTRDSIKNVKDITEEVVDIPEWNGSIRVRSLTGKERDALEAYMLRDKKADDESINMENLRARMAIAACVDEQGAPVFAEADLHWLGGKNACALNRIFTVGMRLSGMSKEDVKDLTKNSNATQEEDSNSD